MHRRPRLQALETACAARSHMVILNNQLREELWNARFHEKLSRKECVRRFVTLKKACQSEVYMTLRQFQMSTTSQYTGRRERRLAIDKNKDKLCGPVRRSQCRSHTTQQRAATKQNWAAIEAQRHRLLRHDASIPLPRGNLRSCACIGGRVAAAVEAMTGSVGEAARAFWLRR